MRFVDRAGFRAARRHFSTWALAVSSAILGAWEIFPDALIAALGPEAVKWVARVALATTIYGLVGKFIAQPEKPPRRRKTP